MRHAILGDTQRSRPAGGLARRALLVVLLASTLLQLPAVAEAAQPSRPPEDRCRWQMIQGGALRVLAQSCDYGFRKITHRVAGAGLVQEFSDAPNADPVIELFEKRRGQSPQSALEEMFIRKLSTYERAHCVVRRATRDEMESPLKAKGKSAWTIVPDEEYAAKIRKATPENEIPEPSCGDHGSPVDYRAYFEFHEDAPDHFAWVIIGQDTPLFDEQSLEF